MSCKRSSRHACTRWTNTAAALELSTECGVDRLPGACLHEAPCGGDDGQHEAARDRDHLELRPASERADVVRERGRHAIDARIAGRIQEHRNVARGRRTFRGLLLEAVFDHAKDGRRHALDFAGERRRIDAENRGHRVGHRLAAERVGTRQEFVEHDAERE